MALKLQPEEKEAIRNYYLKGYNQRKIAKLIKRTPVTVNKYINGELESQLEKEQKELELAHNKLNPYKVTVEAIEQKVLGFIDNIFNDKDLTKINPELKFQAKIKLIEVLNKGSK